MQCSGKSTWSKDLVTTTQTYKRICRDDIRYMLSNYTFDKANEEIVTKIEQQTIEALIKDGFNLVFDKMNLSREYLEKDIHFVNSVCEKYGYESHIEIKEFPITLGEALTRNKGRGDKNITDEVLKRTWRKYEIELKRMIKRSRPVIVRDDSLPDAIIVDIDGTTSDSTERRVFDETMVSGDHVIAPMKDLLRRIPFVNNVKILFVSGRKASCREDTEKWLKGVSHYDALFMRDKSDSRNDVEVKSDIYEEQIKGKYNILYVFDDRPRVLDMWVSKGLFTLNVNQDPLCKNNF